MRPAPPGNEGQKENKMSASYWNTVNESGEGYIQHAPEARSKNQIECEIFAAEDDLKSAKINAAYKDGQGGTAYKVERLENKIAALEAERDALPPDSHVAAAPVAPAAVAKLTAQHNPGMTWFYVSGRFTRAQLVAKRDKAAAAAAAGGEIFGAEARAIVVSITKLIGE